MGVFGTNDLRAAAAPRAYAVWVAVLVSALGVLPVSFLPAMFVDRTTFAEIFAGVLALYLATAASVWIVFALAARRERAWLAAQPFAIEGWDWALAHRWNEKARLYVWFRGKRAAEAEVIDAMVGDHGEWTAQQDDGGAVRLERTPGVGREKDGNRTYYVWFHQLAARQLAALHAANPVARVTFRP